MYTKFREDLGVSESPFTVADVRQVKYLLHFLIFLATLLQNMQFLGIPYKEVTFNVAIFRNAKPQSRRERRWTRDEGRAMIVREKNNSFSRANNSPGQIYVARGTAWGSLKGTIYEPMVVHFPGNLIVEETRGPTRNARDAKTGCPLPRKIVPYA